MQRGSRVLFNDLFGDVPQVATKEEGTKKGRSSELNAKRNELLIARYYYYGKFFDIRYQSILRKLESEFCLSICTITEVLQDNSEVLRQIKKQQPEKKWFKERWGWWVWN